MRVRVSAQFLLLERSWHRSQGKRGPMRVRVSAQFLPLERSWHRSQGKGEPMRVREAHNSFSWNGNGIGLRVKGDQMRAPEHPFLAQSHFASGLIGFTPSSETRTSEKRGVGFGPPQTCPRPNLLSPPAMRDSPRPRGRGRGGI
jgi:hypothetical protein